MEKGTWEIKKGFTEMFKGGAVIMDVTTAEQAKVAEEAGAVAVMALERVPADIPKSWWSGKNGEHENKRNNASCIYTSYGKSQNRPHRAEARILEALGVDYIDESEVLTPADDKF